MHALRRLLSPASMLLATVLPIGTLWAAPQGGEGPGFAPELVSQRLMRTDDDAFTAESTRWRARFDGAGARMEVRHPSEPGATAAVTLRMTDYGRLEIMQPADVVPPTREGDARLRYVHRDIVERYRVYEGGFEQSFVLPQRPDGRGDFVIGITVVGEGLELPVRDAAHQAIEFRHDGHATVRYGEAIAFARGRPGERIEVATRSDGRGRIELIVPGDFLDSASYPVVVDPAVGPVFLPGGSLLQDSAPDVTWHPEHDTYAFVWQRTFPSNTEIRARVYDANGNPLTPVVAISQSSQCRNPTVCSVNSGFSIFEGFLIVYESGDRLVARLYDQGLGALGGEVNVGTPPPGGRYRNPSLAGGTWNYLLVFDYTPPGANNASEIRATTLWHIGGVTYYGGNLAVLQAVSTGHVRRPRVPRALTYGPYGGEVWARCRVVWERFYETPVPGDYDIWTQAVRSREWNVVPLGPPTPVIGASIVGPDEVSPDIGMVASSFTEPDPQFLVAWEDEGDVRAKRYTLAGAVGADFDVRATSNYEAGPAVGASSCDYSVAYLEIVPPNQFQANVRAARVRLDGTVPVSDRAVDVLNGPSQFGLRASSISPRQVTGVPFTNSIMFTWTGQTGGTFGIDDVRARRFDPVVVSTSPFGSACPGPNGELPAIGVSDRPLPGNAALEFLVTDAPPNSLAVLIVGDILTTTPIAGAPGCHLYMGVPTLGMLATVTDGVGDGQVPLPIPCGIGTGMTLAFQWAVLTPGHNAVGWITSDDLDVFWAQ